MKEFGIFYGSTTGTTEGIAEKIAQALNVDTSDVHNVGNTNVDEVDNYKCLILGSSTWGVGDLQDDWNGFLDKLAAKNLSGKKIALFGCGDSCTFGGSFCDALGTIYNDLQSSGCTFVGFIDNDGYHYDSSTAEIDGRLVGLLVDEMNEPELTDERLNNWIKTIQQEIS